MLDFIDIFKQKIMEYYKKFVPVFLVAAFMFLFPVHTYAATSDYSGVLENSFQFTNESKHFTMEVRHNLGGVVSSFEPLSVAEDINGNIIFNYHNGSYNNTANILAFYNVGSRFAIDFAPELYDYYLILSLYNTYPAASRAHTEPLDLGTSPRMNLLYADYGDTSYNELNNVDYSTTNFTNFFKFSSGDTQGYNFVTKINPRQTANQWPCGIRITSQSSFPCIGNDLSFKGVIVAFPTGNDKSSDILTVLQNIYSDTNDINYSLQILIQLFTGYGIPPELGGSGTISGQDTMAIIEGLIGGNYQLDSYINQYTQVEQSMRNQFETNQTAVSNNFAGWNWGSLSTAVDWTSDYLNKIYDNSGDFRTMFMYPILAGIALIFIGRQGLAAYSRSKKGD